MVGFGNPPHLAVPVSWRSREPHLVLQREGQQGRAGPAQLHLAPLSQLQVQLHGGFGPHCTQINQQLAPNPLPQPCWVLLRHNTALKLSSLKISSLKFSFQELLCCMAVMLGYISGKVTLVLLKFSRNAV